MPNRLTRYAVVAAFLLALALPAAAVADGTFPFSKDPQSDLRFLDEMKDLAKKGKVLFVNNGVHAVPVDTEAYLKFRALEIMLQSNTPEEETQQLIALGKAVGAMKKQTIAVLDELIVETKKEIHPTEAEQEAVASRMADEEKAKAAAAKMIEDNQAAEAGKMIDQQKQIDKAGEMAENPNNLSPEELAESPPAPDANTRTLTVDNTPPPPPDGTPIVEASVPPPSQERQAENGRNEDDDAIEAVQTFVGIAGALTRTHGSRSGGNRGGNAPAPHPQSGHHGC